MKRKELKFVRLQSSKQLIPFHKFITDGKLHYTRIAAKDRVLLLANESFKTKESITILILRLMGMVSLVAILTLHVRSLKIFRWEQTVSGGVLVTYLVAVVGLTLCSGSDKCYGSALQAYLCCTGTALLLVNAGAIWHRWKSSGEATKAVAELLALLGVELKRQVMFKVILNVLAAVALMLDVATVPFYESINEMATGT